jgi:tight adherence protein B
LAAGEGGLAAWAAAQAGTAVEPCATAVLAVHQIGGHAGASTAELLDAVIAALQDAQETADARAAAIAGPKSSARLLQFLPVLGLVLGTAMGANPVAALLGGGAGTAALAAGLGLVALGRMWSGALIRAASRPGGPEAMLAAVLAAALRAGLPLPAALLQVGEAWEGKFGSSLAAVGQALGRGQPWDEAWQSAPAGAPEAGPFTAALRDTLALVWTSGVEAGPLLEGLAARLGRAERRRLTQAAARLGVHLMAPLGLCYLPAFVAIGLVPVMLSLAAGLAPL